MATHVFRGGALYVAEYDFSGVTRSFGLDTEVDALDRTAIGDTTRVSIGGLRSGAWTSELYYDSNNAIPPAMEGTLFTYALQSGGSEALIVSYFPGGAAAEDELCYFLRGRPAKLSLPWNLGEVAMLSLSGESAALGQVNPAQSVVQGRLSARGAAVSASGVGTGRQLGALTSARQAVAMTGHVTDRTGTASVVFTLQSDDNSGFTSPTTRATSSTISAVGDFGMEVASGVITDDYWRVIYTVTGTGTVTFVASMGRINLI